MAAPDGPDLVQEQALGIAPLLVIIPQLLCGLRALLLLRILSLLRGCVAVEPNENHDNGREIAVNHLLTTLNGKKSVSRSTAHL